MGSGRSPTATSPCSRHADCELLTLEIDQEIARLLTQPVHDPPRSRLATTCTSELTDALAASGATTLRVEDLKDLGNLPGLCNRLLSDVPAATLDLAGMVFKQTDPLDRELSRLVVTFAKLLRGRS